MLDAILTGLLWYMVMAAVSFAWVTKYKKVGVLAEYFKAAQKLMDKNDLLLENGARADDHMSVFFLAILFWWSLPFTLWSFSGGKGDK